MRIGIVTACYRPVINGVTRMVALYEARLERIGHDVTIFTLGLPERDVDEPGVVRSPGTRLGQTGYYFAARYTRNAQELLAQMDILHCHHLLMGVELAHRYGRGPIVFTNHTRYDLYASIYTGLPQRIADAVMGRLWPRVTSYCDAVIAPSQSMRCVLEQFGVQGPIKVIANGVEVERFRCPDRPRRKSELGIPESAVLAAYVGRLSAEKNLLVLLEQFARAIKSAPTLHLLLIGDGPLRHELEFQARAMGVVDHLRFSGAVSIDEVGNYLAAADFFVTASVSEVHPLTIIEAMASGLPIAAVSSPGIVDIVEPGVTGILAEELDGGLEDAVLTLVRDAQLRRKMSQAAGRAGKRFDIKNTVDQTLALYWRLLARRQDDERRANQGHIFLSRGWKRSAYARQMSTRISGHG